MLEIDALNKRSVKLIVSFLLCFVFVFSFFVMTIEKSEAIATIPLVAIPIIKLLIACGVTFASVDAMIETYNRIKGTTYYNTLTGYILNTTQESIDYIKAEFGDALQNYYPGWDPRDPTIVDLLLGTLALEITKSDNFFQDFLNWFGVFKNDLDLGITTITEDSFDLSEIQAAEDYYENKYYYLTGDTDIYCPIGDIVLHLKGRVHDSGNSICVLIGIPGIDPITNEPYVYKSPTGWCSTIHNPTHSGKYNTAIFRIDSLYFSDKGTYYKIGFEVTNFLNKSSGSSYYSSSGSVYFDIYKNDLPVIEIDETDDDLIEISDDNFQNDEKEKVEIYVPMPNEVITYDPDTGLDIDFDTEISIEEFEELMTPYVGSTWEDIKQDKPIPSKIPTDVPYPDDSVVPDPLIPEMPDLGEDDLPPDAGEGDDPFAGADEEEKIDWDPLKGINLHKKFPFCIPWDLYDSFKSFNVQGEPPKWEIKYLDDVEFIIDFAIFEPWAVIVRWGLLIIFNIGLIIITRNLIRG